MHARRSTGSPTVGDRLAAARRRSLIGRTQELADIRRLLVDGDRDTVVVHVHGPGGVGKTTLLRAVADLAENLDAAPLWLDGNDIDPSPHGFLSALRDAAGAGPGSDVADMLPARAVLLVDALDSLGAIDGWLRHELLPSLPADAVVVTAGRHPLSGGWVDEAGWHALVHVVALRNLPPPDAAALLVAHDVPADEVDDLVRLTRGHPLALVIAADSLAAGPHQAGSAAGALFDHPDAAARLLGRFVDDVIDPLHRDALHVCGHARRVDRAMLAEVLEVDLATADDLLAWLRNRPYAVVHPDGLTVHDVVRDALDHDLRWRDREAFGVLHGRIRAITIRRMHQREGLAQQRAALDLLFLHRGNPVAGQLYGFDAMGALTTRLMTVDERSTVAEMFGRVQGAAHEAVARHWLTHQPEAFHVHVAADGSLAGATGVVRLDLAASDVLADDPVAVHAMAELRDRRPTETGEVTLHQVFVDALSPHELGEVSDMVAVLSLREWTVPRLGWVVVRTPFEATWAPMWTYIGFERLAPLVLPDGTEVGVWARDFARSPYDEWLDALAGRELDDTGVPPTPLTTPVALSRPDFEVAVRAALRDLHRPDRLADNPLTASRLVGGAPAGEAVDRLVARIRDAVVQLDADRVDERGARALDRTYLRPAGTQEAAAEVLGLPFSTYRRHLAAGTLRLVQVLWGWEVTGGR